MPKGRNSGFFGHPQKNVFVRVFLFTSENNGAIFYM